MPLSRKKSCTQCRVAKVRCNLHLPSCSRCSQRALSCKYDNISIGQSATERPSKNTVRWTNGVSDTPTSGTTELSQVGYPEALNCSKSSATEVQDVAMNSRLCVQEFMGNIPEMETGLTEVSCMLSGPSPVDMSSTSGAPDVRFDEIVSLNPPYLTSLLIKLS
jgi:hypothetical protein